MRIVSLKGDIMKVIDYLGIRADGVNIYGYSTYKRMSSKELTEVQNAFPTDLSNIKSLTTSINDEVNIISGNEFEFDVLSYKSYKRRIMRNNMRRRPRQNKIAYKRSLHNCIRQVQTF